MRRKVPTATFVPKTDLEQRCKEIALDVGEPYINFILSVLKKSNIEVIEEGYRDFVRATDDFEAKGDPIQNRGAFFNTCIEGAYNNWLYSGRKDGE